MSDQIQNKSPRHPKRRLRWGRLIGFLVALVIILGAMLAAGTWVYHRYFAPKVPVVAANDEIGNDELLNKRINVLIMGIDDGDSEDFDKPAKRTDAMMVASFDPENNKVALVSLPRDTRVEIPGESGHDKVNAAYAYGGVKLAEKTVANLLKIPIHYYIVANWQGFIDIVDILGGVDLYVEHNMNYEDPYANLEIHIKQGYQHLDGKEAGKYVRFRHDELGDIGRVQRQQKFLKALAGEFFNIGNVVKFPVLLNTISKYVDTDMDALTMIRAANSFKLFGGERMRSEMLYGNFRTIGGISYWATSPNMIQLTLDKLEIPHGVIPGADKDILQKIGPGKTWEDLATPDPNEGAGEAPAAVAKPPSKKQEKAVVKKAPAKTSGATTKNKTKN